LREARRRKYLAAAAPAPRGCKCRSVACWKKS